MKRKVVLAVCLVAFEVSVSADEAPLVNGKLLTPNASLRNADLSDADFQAADLTEANLSGANLSFSICTNVVFSGANLSSAILTNADVTAADFTGAVLTGTRVQAANFTTADFSAVVSGNITGVPAALPSSWQLIQGYLIGPTANLVGANLSGQNLNGVDLNDVDLTGANLSGVISGNITGTPAALPPSWQLTRGYLIGPSANLSGVDLAGATLTNANLRGVNLSYADLSGTDLSGVDFSNANLDGADLSNVVSGNIMGFPSALPTQWQLVKGYLIGPFANLSGADLTGADLTRVNIRGANLTGANLTGADVSGTWMEFQSKAELEWMSPDRYSLAEIMDLRPGSSLFAVSNGMAKIELVVETSTNLVDWDSVSNMPSVDVPADSPVKFFRYGRD